MINYDFLNKSIGFYSNQGFKRIESPWLVSEKINDITCPPTASKYYVKKDDKLKTFVASGEQSFLYLINKGFLPEGQYQTTTPCMRNDDFDQWHTKYFIKNELISFSDSVNDITVDLVFNCAFQFFKTLIPVKNQHLLKKVETSDGFDIEFAGIEVGSYGLRSCEFVKWVYGTGLAEPRFSKILDYVTNR